MTNSIEELEDTDVILIIGSNTTENHPVIGMKIKRATKKGAKLIVAEPRTTEITNYAEIVLPLKPGTDTALLNGMMHVIIKEGLLDQQFIDSRTEGFAELAEVLKKYTPECVAGITGVSAEEIIKAARLYATAGRASIVYCMGLTQHSCGTDNVLSVANLSMLTGNIGREGTGVNPLRGQNNVQGACDMGALPNVFTGYQPVINAEVRSKFSKAWGVADLPKNPGMTLTDIFNATYDGKIKGLYIIGENPMVSDPDLHHVREALKKLEFLVVQDIFLTETALMADVVFPAASFAEKEGTFTSTERRVQRVRKAIDPVGNARTDGEIICGLATKMGYPLTYTSSEEVMAEITALTPSYAGISYTRLEGPGIQWPCPDQNHPGTKFLHQGQFTRGLGKFHPVEYTPPAEQPDAEYPLILSTGRTLFHYHTGTMTRRARALHEHYPEVKIEINPAKAKELGIQEGERIRLSTRRGSIEAKACITEKVLKDMVFMTFHFAEAAANILTNAVLDPVAKIPEYKVCAVKIEKISASESFK
jgi:formate dehydrogenase major subunit